MVHLAPPTPRTLLAGGLLLLPLVTRAPIDARVMESPSAREFVLKQDPEETQDEESSSACADCHPTETETIRESLHLGLFLHGADERAQCERCHGNGEDHIDSLDPEDLKTAYSFLDRDGIVKACAACHAQDMKRVHGWKGSDHDLLEKSCLDCHVVHQRRKDTPHWQEHRTFRTRDLLHEKAEPVGGAKCLECHPSKAAELRTSVHAFLAPKALEPEPLEPEGEGKRAPEQARTGAQAHQSCETCHGHGSLHVKGRGTKRHIARPDELLRASTATCRSCHEDVHPTRFHWKDEERLISRSITCATCHRIHTDKAHGNRAGFTGRTR